MNIDVRNIDNDWLDAIQGIINTNPSINTSAKAIRFASIQYDLNKKNVLNLKKEIDSLNRKIDKMEEQQQEVKAYFKLQNKLNKIFT